VAARPSSPRAAPDEAARALHLDARRVGQALEAGIVALNTGFISTEVAPFDGVGEPGIGREGSTYGLDEWLELEYFAVAGL
jgi:succinate-semialdehyde dehydrogenase/glutarate-semialdehyde dehydrogenase